MGKRVFYRHIIDSMNRIHLIGINNLFHHCANCALVQFTQNNINFCFTRHSVMIMHSLMIHVSKVAYILLLNVLDTKM